MGTCEPCGDDGGHRPECDHSSLTSQLLMARSLCADIHANRKDVMAQRDKYKAQRDQLAALLPSADVLAIIRPE